ncbi:MAG: aminoacyl-tRNA hydrolase [Alphaproteobacteria bacterium]|nr:MAG: aminoacyl-tRNA hydrolase [Alphaproteobacteria bacterium]
MHLIVGLGNPGSEYQNNRHNVGFMVIDALVKKYHLSGPKRKFESEVYEGNIKDYRVIAIKPQTFMNVSGVAVEQAMNFYKIPLDKIIVIHDELDIDPGELRFKSGGGSAGHNGLRSIDASIGNNYNRLRFGIGHPGHKDAVSSFVLHDFDKSENILVHEVIYEHLTDAFDLFLSGKHNNFLSTFKIA